METINIRKGDLERQLMWVLIRRFAHYFPDGDTNKAAEMAAEMVADVLNANKRDALIKLGEEIALCGDLVLNHPSKAVARSLEELGDALKGIIEGLKE
jgi:hypothetical protein